MRELLQQGTDSLLRERASHERTNAIQLAQHVLDVHRAERRSEREWKTLSVTLQKQIGLEQTRIADIQLQWTRAQNKFTERVSHFEIKLAKEHAARMLVHAQLEVFPLFLIF